MVAAPVGSNSADSAAAKAKYRRGLSQISGAGLLWGTAGVVVQLLHRGAGDHLSISAIAFWRLAAAAVVLLALTARTPRTLLAAIRANPVQLLLTGVGLAGYQALYFLAVVNAGVSVATVISLGVAPVLTAGWEFLMSRTAPSRATVAILAAGLLGLLVISTAPTQHTAATPHPVLGICAAAGSGLGYAATTILNRQLSNRIPTLVLTTASTTVGALALAPLAAAGGFAVGPRPITLLALGYLGIVTTAVAYVLFYAGLRTTPGSTAAVLTLLEPLTAAVLAVLILREPLSGQTVLGGALLLAAVIALYRPAGPRRRARST